MQCDKCELWFHLVCVGLNKDDLKEDEDYACFSCQQGSSKQLPIPSVSAKLSEASQPAKENQSSSSTQSTENSLLKIDDIKEEPSEDMNSLPCTPGETAAAEKAVFDVVEAVAASSKERKIEAERRDDAVASILSLNTGIVLSPTRVDAVENVAKKGDNSSTSIGVGVMMDNANNSNINSSIDTESGSGGMSVEKADETNVSVEMDGVDDASKREEDMEDDEDEKGMEIDEDERDEEEEEEGEEGDEEEEEEEIELDEEEEEEEEGNGENNMKGDNVEEVEEEVLEACEENVVKVNSSEGTALSSPGQEEIECAQLLESLKSGGSHLPTFSGATSPTEAGQLSTSTSSSSSATDTAPSSNASETAEGKSDS